MRRSEALQGVHVMRFLDILGRYEAAEFNQVEAGELLGIDSVHCPMARRLEARRRLALDLDRGKLAAMTETIPLAEVFEAGARTLKGETRGPRGDDPVSGGRQMQPEGERSANKSQANPSRSKQIQAKMLGFVWFYSSEPGLFNGLRAKK